jgi:hypothetical protein
MSDLKEGAAKVTDAAGAAAEQATKVADRALEVSSVRRAIRAVKRHPLGVIALVGGAAALVEVELAVGILAGMGATALLASTSGPEARQEVVAKSKWAFERARALTSRAKSQTAEAVSAAAEQIPPTSG